jgi:hypothetical protein
MEPKEKSEDIKVYQGDEQDPPLNREDVRNILLGELRNLRSPIITYRGNRTVIGGPSDYNAIYIDDTTTGVFPTIDARRSIGTGTVYYGRTDSAAGHVYEALGQSNTSVVRIANNNSGAYSRPLELVKVNATSTNFYRMEDSNGGPDGSPVAVVTTYIANNTTPNGTLSGASGDICKSTNGSLYICQGGTVWDEVAVTNAIGFNYFWSSDCSWGGTSRAATSTAGTGVADISAGAGAHVKSSASGDYASWYLDFDPNGSNNPYSGNPTFIIGINFNAGSGSNNCDAFFGLGNQTGTAGGSLGNNINSVGFYIKRESGVNNLYAFQNTSSGGAGTLSSVLTTLAAADSLQVKAVITSGTSTAFYYNKNGSTWTLGATISATLPSGASVGRFALTTSSANVAGTMEFTTTGITYYR